MLRRLEPALGAITVLLLVVVAAGLGAPFRLVAERDGLDVEVPQMVPPPAPAETAPPLEPAPGTPGFPWQNVLVVLAVLAVLAVLIYSLRQVWRTRLHHREEFFEVDDVAEDATGTRPGGVVNLPALADAVEEALQRLDDVREPRDAVVAAWVELENAAARHGWERDPAETSTEFTAHLLAVSPAPAEAIATLRRLYQHARFAAHPVTGDDVLSARAALESIARELEKRRSKAPAPTGTDQAGGAA